MAPSPYRSSDLANVPFRVLVSHLDSQTAPEDAYVSCQLFAGDDEELCLPETTAHQEGRPSFHEWLSLPVTVDALPARQFLGHVSEIALEAVSYRGDVTYPVTVVLDETVPELRSGMTALVKIPKK